MMLTFFYCPLVLDTAIVDPLLLLDTSAADALLLFDNFLMVTVSVFFYTFLFYAVEI